MNRIKLLLAGLLLVAAPLAAVTTAAPSSAVPDITAPRVTDCVYDWTADYATETWTVFNHKVHVGGQVKSRNCIGADGKRRVQPIRYDILCESEGRKPLSVTHNFIFWDADGHSYNPGAKEIDCPNDGAPAQEAYYLDSSTTPWFHDCAAGLPRWRDDVDIDYAFPQGGDTASLSKYFWGFTGPVTIDC